MAKLLDFDAPRGDEKAVVGFVRSFFENSRNADQQRRQSDKRIYEMYKMERDMVNRDPNRSNIHTAKLYSIVETIVPHYTDAMLGIRPIIPIEFINPDQQLIGQIQSTLLDAYLTDSNFYWEFVKLIKYIILYGTGFIESVPDFKSKRVKRFIPRTSIGPDGRPVLVGVDEQVQDEVFLRLMFKAYPPWEVYRDPSAQSVGESRGIIKYRGMVSKRQLAEMAKRNSTFPNFDPEKLTADMYSQHKDNWTLRMAQDVGASLPMSDDDLGVWMSYESEGRYIDIWNFSSILRDIDNPYDHKEINLTRVINTDDPNPAMSWYGIGEGRPVENLCHALNENWDQAFDNHNLQNQGVMFYDDDALNVDQLIMIPGNRIKVVPQVGHSVADAVYERPTPGLNSDFYNIPNHLERMVDQASGLDEITRGEVSRSGQTAREAVLKRSAGESRMKQKIKMGEHMGLKDIGEKCLSHIDQFAGPDDIIAKIGIERASMLPTVKPTDIGSPYIFNFKGSDRLNELQVKRQNMRDIYQLTAGNPSVRQDWLADKLLEIHDIPEDERQKGIIPDEQAMMIQAQNAALQAQAQAQGQGGAETTRSVATGRAIGASAGNSPTGRTQQERNLA